MAPEAYQPHVLTPKTPLLPRISPNYRYKHILHHTWCRPGGRIMAKLTKRNLIPVLALILCTASVSRFLNINMITTSSIDVPFAALRSSNHTTHTHTQNEEDTTLTDKEVQFLHKFFSTRVPCNLLVFGNADQYLDVSKLNAGGLTIFLDENGNTMNSVKSHRIMYHTTASGAFKLLKEARGNPECSPNIQIHAQVSRCKLALPNLPQEVYDTMWDVVVVDGPRGNTPDSPGRMASIYTASLLARRGKTTHVVVHDVNRMIEKWFSREFLCEENLISSKGRLQDFHIKATNTSPTFCAS